jgi:EAL domain-containing protein (putative c-di-GMP-specific phosphodiesterase class I)/PAS domain-containing protein
MTSSAGVQADYEELLEFVYMMPVGVLKFRADGDIVMVNAAASQLLMPLTGAAGMANIYDGLRDLVPELAGKVRAFDAEAGVVIDQHRIDAHAGGQHMTLSLTVTRIRQDAFMASFKDITTLTETLAFALSAADLLIDIDRNGAVEWAGGAFERLLGIQPRDAVGRQVGTIVAPRNRDTLRKAITALATNGRFPPLLMNLANRARSNCVIAGMAFGGVRERLLLTVSPPPRKTLDIKPRDDQSRAFVNEVESWLRQGEPRKLGLLDIKGWADTAASLNPAQLDRLRTELARVTEGAAGEGLVVGQIGDGRFGVLAADEADFARLGDALRDLVGQVSKGRQMKVEGVQIDIDTGSLSLSQSLHALRLAMLRFGREGATSAGLAGGLLGIIEQANGQRRALASSIADGRFALAFQPIVSLQDRSLHHYEALLRPEPGPGQPAASPQEFVTLAEAVGLSQELDLAVLRRSLSAMRQTDVAIAVNISGDSIADPAFITRFLEVIEGLPPGKLLIEVTETAEIADLHAASAQFHRLRAAHVGISLDDFGAGGASFRYVRDLQVDFVKIDGAFVRAAGRGEQGLSIVRAMRDLATSAGAETIAEMVETEAEAALMRSIGVGFGQGWLFGRPGPLPAMG